MAAKGAMFNSPKCSVSKETQDLLNRLWRIYKLCKIIEGGERYENIMKFYDDNLNVMMKESKLTNFQRKQLNSKLNEGKPLPVSCGPTSTAKKKSSPIQRSPKKTSTSVNPLSGKRNKETIDLLSESNKDAPYRPMPGKYISVKDKEKLQDRMAYGEEDVTHDQKPHPNIVDDNENSMEKLDEFDEVLQEIEERRQFLDDMEKLGKGKQYRTLIGTEISQKIRELEVIDKKRTEELERALKENNS